MNLSFFPDSGDFTFDASADRGEAQPTQDRQGRRTGRRRPIAELAVSVVAPAVSRPSRRDAARVIVSGLTVAKLSPPRTVTGVVLPLVVPLPSSPLALVAPALLDARFGVYAASPDATLAAMEAAIAKAKTYLDARRGERVTLEELARAVGASPFHLQRRFKQAFGISPRDYQDAQRLEAVKSSLKNGSRVTEALYDAGYGSSSRFYEKAASSLGMAARRYRANGRGETIRYSVFTLPIGTILVAATSRGVCAVKLGDDEATLKRLIGEEFSAAELIEDSSALREIRQSIASFLSGKGNLARVPVDLRGTVFQRRVWQALSRIPRGETRTYGEIARAIGNPAAVRAVGSACGANPVALVVPCHRAVRTDGGLGGYAWGIARKKRLLELEKPTKK